MEDRRGAGIDPKERRSRVEGVRLRGFLAVVFGLVVLFVVACSPPGANTGGGSGGGSSEEVEQKVAEETGGETAEACDLQPPEGLDSIEDAVVGFSQSEKEVTPFRIAETESVRSEAKKRGVKEFLYTNAQSQQPKQISDIRDMIAQDVDIIIASSLASEGFEPALEAAKEAGVPIFLIDREIEAEPCEDYVTVMHSDFLEQGRMAGEAMIEATGGEANIAILEGDPGTSASQERTDGFVEVVEQEANMEVVASQPANFVRTEGQEVMEQLIQANPDIDAVYAANDEMALGALQALRDAGKTPGEDVQIVSIDGTRGAVQGIIDGEIAAVIETNPRFGPLAFDQIEKFLAGEPVPPQIIVQDRVFDESNAEQVIDEAY